MNFDKFNGQRKSVFELKNSKEYKFIEKTSDLDGNIYRLDGCYIAQSKFGKQSVFFCSNSSDKVRISLSNPETVEKIIADTEMVDAIKNGKVAIEFNCYHSKKYNKTCWGCTFSEYVMY